MIDEPVLYINPAVLYIPYKANIKQHLAWLYFLYNAQDEWQVKKSFVVSLQTLKDGIQYKSEKNNQVLIESIKKLTKVRVQFDMFNPTTDWPYQALLQRCQIPKYTGGCRYSFHPNLHKLLSQKEHSKPLRINIIRQFRSKHSLAIYCLLVSQLAAGITYTEVKMNLAEMTRFLGYDDEDVLLPGDLKRKLVKQVQGELSEKSDLSVHIEVLQEKRRKIAGFKLIAQLKPSQQKIYQQLYEGPSEELAEASILQQQPKIKVAQQKIVTSSTDPASVSTPSPVIAKAPLTPEQFAAQTKQIVVQEAINLETIEHPQIKAEALKRFEKRLHSHYKTELQEQLQAHLEQNFAVYRETFVEVIEKSINSLMLRNIVNRNMGRKNPALMKLSQTVADGVMEKAELFGFEAPDFENWRNQFEIDPNQAEIINGFKSDALKTAKQIYRY